MPLNIETNNLWIIPTFFTLCYFILDDFTKYITHALMHKVPVLWEIHKTHHSARTLTPLTIFRTHPIEGVIFVIRSAFTQGIVISTFYYVYGGNITFVTILGANLFSFWFHLFGSNLRHSHIKLNYWNWLEKILISPAQHQIHHSIKKEHHNKNFGVALALWDFLFGSLHLSKSNEYIEFGISNKKHKYENNIIYLYISPFIGIYKIFSNYVSSQNINDKKQNLKFNKQTRY
jgi:sterol desaturase/sphingolipid hydroxylase (fatty acid hydroxylase superfamily)